MCLTYVDEKIKVKETDKYWYKIVDKSYLEPKFDFVSPWYGFGIKLNTWYRNTDTKCHGVLLTTECPARVYFNGFHFYAEECLPELCLCHKYVLRCQVRTVSTTGHDQYGRACVAQEFIALNVVDTEKYFEEVKEENSNA